MWSPKTNKDGGFNQFYENMTETDVGDIVFSFADTLIKTVGVVSSPARPKTANLRGRFCQPLFAFQHGIPIDPGQN